MSGLFPDDAMIRQVSGEVILLLGGGRALLMQLAHPQVAAGVADHSGFAEDPFGRLRRTLEATYTIVFGTEAEADLVARQLWAVHEHVTGPGYEANDPELLMWVHATLVDTALRVHARFLRPLRPKDAERYYQDSMVVGDVLGVPRDHQPPDLVAFNRYMRHMVGSLQVSDTARQLADAVLHPRLPFVAEPGMAFARELTAGLLPRPLRQQFGLGWDRNRKAALLLAGVASRTVLPRVPSVLRRAPTTILA
ncbi:MAG TPA: oxygenase MpaB family protein [Acidimicrobiales bacterium]|jgi:uncharacterized protein (DUF2236 family)|nr:oxygenase MpaB family protein [Acidimicrobiales bacterium]